MAKRKTARRKSWTKRYAMLSRRGRLAAGAALLLAVGIAIGLALRPLPKHPVRGEAGGAGIAVEKPRPPQAQSSSIAPAPSWTHESAPPPMPAPPEPQAQSQPHAAAPPADELAWRRYAIAEPAFDGRPQIAIVIDDVGVDRRRSLRAVALPPQVTLAYLPYPDDVAQQVEHARAAGHEILVHMPMQPDDLAHNDPGPNALLTNLDRAELERRVNWNLDRFGGYVGVNNHMGSRFTASATLMEPLLEQIKGRGLMFLDSRTSPDSVGAGLARRLAVPTATRDVFLDNDDRADKVARQLAIAEGVARHRGYAIAIGHPHDGTLDALEKWLPTLPSKGFVLVPVTAIAVRSANG
ncbi:MAG TPA: divergent polysaccharide deacetylase family protein [Candidatus Cybelea sp.]|nr:divergent polysaccharide deacetylase family protein [Candidatus Cybelea sp.]